MPAGVTFNAFVVSLVATAAVHFGDVADRSYGEKPPANAAAAHAIEMLSLLEEKTRGNLAEDEKAFLGQALYELRVRLAVARKTVPNSG